MLEIVIPAQSGTEYFNEETQEFIETDSIDKDITLRLEHSLISLSLWESKWQKPFMTKEDKTPEETISYIKCMTLNKNISDSVYDRLTMKDIESINAYIENPMTATTFSESARGGGREIVTSELIYYWMIAHTIPVEFEKWHLNRLLTLIRICNVKNQPQQKMSKGEILRNNAALNAARRKKHNSKG